MALGKNYVVSKVARLKICHWFLKVSQRMLPFYQIFRIVKADMYHSAWYGFMGYSILKKVFNRPF